MAFPSSADTFPTITAGTYQDDSGFEADTLLNRAFAAIIALEAKLGIGSSTSVNATVLRGTGSGTTAFGAVQTGDITANAITVRPAAAAGSTNPTTTNTTTAALANPTVSITLAVTSDVVVMACGEINDGTGGAQVGYHVRIGGGAWTQIAETSPPSSAGRFALSGFHIFQAVTAGTYSVEIGNSSSTGANTISHYAVGRRLLVIGIAR